MKGQRVRIRSWAAGAAVLAAAPAFAQRPAAAPVTETVRVHVVNVDVVATGTNGQPVLDLRPDEFQLFEDGVPVRLTNFLPPAPDAARSAGEATGAIRSTPEIAPPPEEAQQRTLIVFVDDLNLSRLTRSLVLERLGRFMDGQLRNGYREVLLRFDLSLHDLTSLTTDRKTVAAAVERLRSRVNEGEAMRGERDRLVGDLGRGAAVGGGLVPDVARQGLLGEAGMFALEQVQRQRSLLGALLEVVDSFSGMPGRKALLLVSEGIPVAPGSDGLAEAGAPFGEGFESSVDLRMRCVEVARHANAGRITFYTINVPPPGGAVSAETRGMSLATAGAGGTLGREQSLSEFTVATGGQKLYNPEMLARMSSDLDGAYSLGYSPSHFGDGKYHRLSVKVSRADVSVRSREGYLDKTEVQRQADRTTAALRAGGNANPLGARLALGGAKAQGRRKLLVPLTVTIPAANLTLLPSRGAEEGKVTITIAVTKFNGRTSKVHRQTFPIKVPEAALAGFLRQDTTFEFSLLLQPGDSRVSVTARDETAQAESVVVAALVSSAGGR